MIYLDDFSSLSCLHGFDNFPALLVSVQSIYSAIYPAIFMSFCSL
jgi:hypothetical protein